MFKKLISLSLLAALSACALPTGLDRYDLNVLPNWLLNRNEKLSANSLPIEFISDQWWKRVNDPQLSALIQAGLKDSASARVAAAKTAAAAAQLGISKADLLPQLGIRAEATRQELSKNYYVPPQFGGIPLNIGQITGNLQWNLDLWGQQRQAIEAAQGQLNALNAEQALVGLQLSAQIARAYVQLRWTKAQLQELELIRKAQERFGQLQETRLSLGLDSGAGLDQAKDAYAQTQLLMEQTKGTQARLIAALESLVGDVAVTNAAVNALEASLPAPLLDFSSAQPLPLSLLARRPDLVGERFRVQAAAAQVDVARLAVLPNINLNAYLGRQSIGFDRLSDPNSKVAFLGGVLLFPIFDAGKIRFQTEAKKAEFEARKAQYEASITNAAQEVIAEVLMLEQYKAETKSQSNRLDSLQRQTERSQKRYELGIDSALPALESEVAWRYQKLRILEVGLKSLGNQIDLLLALGGGYENPMVKQQITGQQ